MLERVASFQEERTKQSRMDALFRKQEDGGKIERLKNDLQATLHRFNVGVHASPLALEFTDGFVDRGADTDRSSGSEYGIGR